jgi:GNAT superfamily N-acetyltransferase
MSNSMEHPPTPANTGAPSAELERLTAGVDLWTGEHISARPIQPDDTARLQEFHSRLSSDSVIFRFFRFVPTLPLADAEHFTHVDYNDRMALLATKGSGDDEYILGVVRYDRISPNTAEVAFVVEDHWQGHGIATALLLRLAPYARARGITHFLAITMATNDKMLEVLRRAGYPFSSHYSGGEYSVTLDISAPVANEPGGEA